MKRLLTFIIAVLVLAPHYAMAQVYHLDPAQTTIGFKINNMGIMSVSGTFGKFKGTVDIDDTDITKSKVDVSIETVSINTGIDRRDNHLRSEDFFDVKKFPAMTFVSTKVESDKEKLKVYGDLTIRGITKPVVLSVEGPSGLPGDAKRTATATTTVNRKEFGVSWEGWWAVIADNALITINAVLVKQ